MWVKDGSEHVALGAPEVPPEAVGIAAAQKSSALCSRWITRPLTGIRPFEYDAIHASSARCWVEDAATLNHRTVFASVLWSSCLAMLAVGANSTAIMAALPDMRTELSLSSAGVEWAVNAYLVVSAACIVLGGQAADRFGSRLASMFGLTLFGVASCIIAAAFEQTALLAGRALQGLAAAFAVPSTLAAVDTSARSGAQGSGDRRLGRVPDAWLQHWAAARRRAYSRHRLAPDLLAQRPAHVDRHCWSSLRRLGDRP